MKLIDRVEDPLKTVEFTVEGRGVGLAVVLLLGAGYLVVFPPTSAPPLRWLSAVVSVALISSLLRDVRWSPFFAGPLLTLSPGAISGRGGLVQQAWQLSWDQVDRFDWGRNGLFVYRVGAENWRIPYRQGGIGGPLLVRALTKRLNAYHALSGAAGRGIA